MIDGTSQAPRDTQQTREYVSTLDDGYVGTNHRLDLGHALVPQEVIIQRAIDAEKIFCFLGSAAFTLEEFENTHKHITLGYN